MKLFSMLCGALSANPLMNYMVADELGLDTTEKMVFLMQDNFFGGNTYQQEPMNALLPLLLLKDDDTTTQTQTETDKDNSKLMMLMLMQNPSCKYFSNSKYFPVLEHYLSLYGPS